MRAEAAADEHHVEHADDGQGDANPGELEEAEGRQAVRVQGCAHQDVRRCADHRDRAADVRSDGECHELRGDGKPRGGADLHDDGDQAGDGRRV